MEFIMEFLFLYSSNVFFHVSVTAVLKEYLRNYMLLMLLFLKSPFRDQLFHCFSLMTLLVILFAILLYLLTILITPVSVLGLI